MGDAKKELEKVEKEAVLKKEKELEKDVKAMEEPLKKALGNMLRKKGYSKEEALEVEKEFSKQLKAKVNNYVEAEGDYFVDEVMKADLDENAEKKEIIEDANSMQEYLAEEA